MEHLPYDGATPQQTSFIFDLICRHPDFQKKHHHDVWDAEESWIVDWINEKMNERIPTKIEKLADLEKEIASGLITHLQLAEKERHA